MRVLLAEDDSDVQQLLALVLTKAGMDVDVADNGRDACRRAWESDTEGKPYDMILMDIKMPEMDGYQATTELRDRGWHGPIVALTAHAMSGDEQKCHDVGCNDYISKPIDHMRLLTVIARNIQ